MVEYKIQSTEDLNRICPSIGTWDREHTKQLCDILYEQGYLDKNKRSYWIIGPRSYIELRSHIENSMREIYNEEYNGQEGADESGLDALTHNLEKLPQILFY